MADAPLDHAPLDALLAAVVKAPRPGTADRTWVDWDAVAARLPSLEAWLALVARASVRQLADEDRLAFYTNAYNALVLRAFLAHGRKRVVDVRGFFDAAQFPVAGEMLTLNALEEAKLRLLDGRGRSRDPRVHFVVNCASRDCPPLAARAYRGKTWQVDLEERTRAFLRRPGEVQVDEAGHRVVVVQIFEWYAADFGGEREVRAFIARYRPELRDKLRDAAAWDLDFRPYDWSPNAGP